MTVVEMLVSMVITLVVLFAIVQVFSSLGDSVNVSRATIEMSAQLRSMAHRLQQDLDGLTIRTLPWARYDSGPGYFEYTEGPGYDTNATDHRSRDTGDIDDVLAFTACSKGEPFVATIDGEIVESQVAQIIWWVGYTDRNGNNVWDEGEPRTLNRTVIPVRTDVAPSFTLDELTLRANRFAHGNTIPYEIDTAQLATDRGPLGEDVVLGHLISFDVRAYDPEANEIKRAGYPVDPLDPLVPRDPDYVAPTSDAQVLRRGAYVDLGHGVGTTWFSGPPSGAWTRPIWDTFPFRYERDGVSGRDNVPPDRGTNGLDDDNANGVDDVGERENQPPYPMPLRAIQITIRVMEPGTEEVRQATVVANFVPD